MQKSETLMEEIKQVKIKHPRAADFMAKISRQDDCFAMMFDEKSDDCARCVMKADYKGEEFALKDLCKKLMKIPAVAAIAGPEVPVKTKAAKKPAKEKPAAEAPECVDAAVEEPVEKEVPATVEEKVAEKKPAPVKAEKKPAVKAPVKEKAAPVKKAPAKVAEKKPAPVKAEKPAKEKPVKVKTEKKPGKFVGKVSPDKKPLGKREEIILNLLAKKEYTQSELVAKMGITGCTCNIALNCLLGHDKVVRRPHGKGFIYGLKK